MRLRPCPFPPVEGEPSEGFIMEVRDKSQDIGSGKAWRRLDISDSGNVYFQQRLIELLIAHLIVLEAEQRQVSLPLWDDAVVGPLGA